MDIERNTNGRPSMNSYSDSSLSDCASIKSKSAASVYNAIQKRKQGSMEGVDSLNLLRDNLQYFFNEKIQALMTDFVQTFFHPAIKNIEKNTNETITGDQINNICRDLFESCVKTKFPSSNESLSSPTCSSISSIVEMNVSDSDEGCQQQEAEGTSLSLLHQALKRKRTDSETEQLFKRQFFLSTGPHNKYFNSSNTLQEIEKSPFQTLSSQTKFLPRFTTNSSQTSTTTRPIFHIIQSPNRNLKQTHVELCQLLNQNISNINQQTTLTTTREINKGISSTSVTKETEKEVAERL